MNNAVEIHPNIYMVNIDLRDNPLKSLNVYIIKSPDLSIIIDTGFNTLETVDKISETIRELELDLSKTILFLSHYHADHIGLCDFFMEKKVPIYINKIEGEIIRNLRTVEDSHWQNMIHNAEIQGLGEENVIITEHPGFKYRPTGQFEYIPAEEGDRFHCGNYDFYVMDLSGHTPGMIGLYEPGEGLLFGADHILEKITPTIYYWGDIEGDSLGIYFENLMKIKSLNIKHLFSSHRGKVEDVNLRIDEIIAHHEDRLDEIRFILKNKTNLTVREVTMELSWNITARNWEEFPNSQKWFAAGECHAHLERLRAIGEVNYFIDDKNIYHYYLTNI